MDTSQETSDAQYFQQRDGIKPRRSLALVSAVDMSHGQAEDLSSTGAGGTERRGLEFTVQSLPLGCGQILDLRRGNSARFKSRFVDGEIIDAVESLYSDAESDGRTQSPRRGAGDSGTCRNRDVRSCENSRNSGVVPELVRDVERPGGTGRPRTWAANSGTSGSCDLRGCGGNKLGSGLIPDRIRSASSDVESLEVTQRLGPSDCGTSRPRSARDRNSPAEEEIDSWLSATVIRSSEKRFVTDNGASQGASVNWTTPYQQTRPPRLNTATLLRVEGAVPRDCLTPVSSNPSSGLPPGTVPFSGRSTSSVVGISTSSVTDQTSELTPGTHSVLSKSTMAGPATSGHTNPSSGTLPASTTSLGSTTMLGNQRRRSLPPPQNFGWNAERLVVPYRFATTPLLTTGMRPQRLAGLWPTPILGLCEPSPVATVMPTVQSSGRPQKPGPSDVGATTGPQQNAPDDRSDPSEGAPTRKRKRKRRSLFGYRRRSKRSHPATNSGGPLATSVVANEIPAPVIENAGGPASNSAVANQILGVLTVTKSARRVTSAGPHSAETLVTSGATSSKSLVASQIPELPTMTKNPNPVPNATAASDPSPAGWASATKLPVAVQSATAVANVIPKGAGATKNPNLTPKAPAATPAAFACEVPVLNLPSTTRKPLKPIDNQEKDPFARPSSCAHRNSHLISWMTGKTFGGGPEATYKKSRWESSADVQKVPSASPVRDIFEFIGDDGEDDEVELGGWSTPGSTHRGILLLDSFILFTGLKFLNFLNIKSSLTTFLIPLSHHISMILYPFSLLTVTTHALHLMSLLSNHHRHSKSLIDPSDMLQIIFGTSFLHHSGLLIQMIYPLLSDLHLNMPV